MAGNIPFVNTGVLGQQNQECKDYTEMSYLKRRFGSVKGVSHRKLMNGEQFKRFLRSLSEIHLDLKAERDLQRLGDFIPILWCLHPKRKHWKDDLKSHWSEPRASVRCLLQQPSDPLGWMVCALAAEATGRSRSPQMCSEHHLLPSPAASQARHLIFLSLFNPYLLS